MWWPSTSSGPPRRPTRPEAADGDRAPAPPGRLTWPASVAKARGWAAVRNDDGHVGHRGLPPAVNIGCLLPISFAQQGRRKGGKSVADRHSGRGFDHGGHGGTLGAGRMVRIPHVPATVASGPDDGAVDGSAHYRAWFAPQSPRVPRGPKPCQEPSPPWDCVGLGVTVPEAIRGNQRNEAELRRQTVGVFASRLRGNDVPGRGTRMSRHLSAILFLPSL